MIYRCWTCEKKSTEPFKDHPFCSKVCDTKYLRKAQKQVVKEEKPWLE